MSVMVYEDFEGSSIKWAAVLKASDREILVICFSSNRVYKRWNIDTSSVPMTGKSSPLEILKNFRRLKKNGESVGRYYGSIKSSLGGFTVLGDFDSFDDFHKFEYGTPWERPQTRADVDFPVRAWAGKRVQGW